MSFSAKVTRTKVVQNDTDNASLWLAVQSQTLTKASRTMRDLLEPETWGGALEIMAAELTLVPLVVFCIG